MARSAREKKKTKLSTSNLGTENCPMSSMQRKDTECSVHNGGVEKKVEKKFNDGNGEKGVEAKKEIVVGPKGQRHIACSAIRGSSCIK